MKKILVVALILTMVFGTIAASAQGFVPPGQAKKGFDEADWMQQMLMRMAQGDEYDEDDDESEEMYGPFKLLPPGLQNKGTPPGLQKKGNLPLGQQKRLERGEELPPGIQMRFQETWEGRYEWGPEEENEDKVGIANNEEELVGFLTQGEVELIRLGQNIVLTEPVVIETGRKIWIDGNYRKLTLDVEDDAYTENIMIAVEDGAELYLRHITLDGLIEEENDTNDAIVLETLVMVDEGATLTAYNNTLQNAEVGFSIEVGEGDYEAGDEEYLLEDNYFDEVDEPVEFHDVNGMLYPED